MSYPRLSERLYNAPLLLLPEKAEVIERVFAAYADGRAGELPKVPEAPEREQAALLVPARRVDGGGYSLTDRGVAVITMFGSLVQRAGGLDAMSGLTGYNNITQRLDAALRDPMVRGIVLEVDSPGGESAGAFELATFIAEAVKPVWAVANELAASAAYLVASAADRVILPASARVGSIGVVMLHQDRSQLVEKSGVRYTPIFAGAKKLDGSSLMPLSESARSDLQRQVDEVYAMFVDAVASRRGMKADAVRATEAGMLSAQAAIDGGFADEIGTVTSAILALQDKVTHQGFRFTPRAERAIAQEVSMTSKTETPAAPAPTTATVEQLAQERAAGYSQAEKEVAPKARAEGATAERERVKAIVTCDAAKDRPQLAAHLAFDTDMAAEAAQALLAKAAPEVAGKATNMLDAAMRGTNPQVGPDTGADVKTSASKPKLSAVNIYDIRSKAHGA